MTSSWNVIMLHWFLCMVFKNQFACNLAHLYLCYVHSGHYAASCELFIEILNDVVKPIT